MKKIMTESMHQMPALASTVRHRVTRVHMAVRCVTLSAVLVFANLPATTVAESSCSGIHVKILDIRNSTGSVACALFESPEGFPNKFLRYATNIAMIKIRNGAFF